MHAPLSWKDTGQWDGLSLATLDAFDNTTGSSPLRKEECHRNHLSSYRRHRRSISWEFASQCYRIATDCSATDEGEDHDGDNSTIEGMFQLCFGFGLSF